MNEIESAQQALQTLKDISWAKPLITRINNNGGLCKENKPFLFELRYALNLHNAGIIPNYEWPGINNTTLDFHFSNQYEWNIELASINTSIAIKNGIREDGIFTELFLSSNNKDQKLSEEGEILKAQEKILAKVVKTNSNQSIPIKFPDPTKKIINIILIDMRGYSGLEAADIHDYIEITTGASLIPNEYRHYWFNSKTSKHVSIKGLYEKDNPLSGINFLHERIHFIGFMCEKTYAENEIKEKAIYVPNYNLLSCDEANAIFSHYPLFNAKS